MTYMFWILFAIVFYTYIGYGIVLFFFTRLKRAMVRGRKAGDRPVSYEPEVTLFIAAYNEKDFLPEKVKNSFELDYPRNKLSVVFVTDGSNDGSPELLRSFDGVTVLHEAPRRGKIGALNRGMQYVETPIVVFCDANTMLAKDSIRRIVALFADGRTGCVSGEKRIITRDAEVASAAGEGLYWKYESLLKKWDSELHSVVGAAGELFAIRRELYTPVEPDTILDDFMISLRIAQAGFVTKYDPEAYAMEYASADVGEELKRKVRISAGGIQSMVRLSSLLNIFRYGMLSFQYVSHRVLRWSVTPLCLALLLPIGWILAYREGFQPFGLYTTLFVLQILFYVAALLGWVMENRQVKIKALFVPYYFMIMNLSVFMGLHRYLSKTQAVNWEKARRAG